MKILCIIIVGIAFLLFYQNNPTFALIMIIVLIGGYLFFKLKRRSKGKYSLNKYFNGFKSSDNSNIEKIIVYLLLDKYLNSESQNPELNPPNEKEKYLEQQKQKILDLLRE